MGVPFGLRLRLSGAATANRTPVLRMLLDVQGTVLNLNHNLLQNRFQKDSLRSPPVGTWNETQTTLKNGKHN